MVVNGSLLNGMHKVILKGVSKVISSLAVIVIDEFDQSFLDTTIYDRYNHYPANHVTAAQQKVIMLAQSYNCPIILIQMDPDFPEGSYCYNQRSNLGSYFYATKNPLSTCPTYNKGHK